MAAIVLSDCPAYTHNFKPYTTAAMRRSIIHADFSGVKFIKLTVFAFGNIRHNYIGAALQSLYASLRMQTFHSRGGRNIDVRQHNPH